MQNSNSVKAEQREALNQALINVRTVFLEYVSATNVKEEFCQSSDFQEILTCARECNLINYQVLAAELQVSGSTVSRWLNGMTIPHRYVRSHIINVIVSLVKGEIATLQQGKSLSDTQSRIAESHWAIAAA